MRNENGAVSQGREKKRRVDDEQDVVAGLSASKIEDLLFSRRVFEAAQPIAAHDRSDIGLPVPRAKSAAMRFGSLAAPSTPGGHHWRPKADRGPKISGRRVCHMTT